MPLAHDLTTDASYAGHLTGDQNGDGRPDLTTHFPVPGSGITLATTEVCVTGEFNVGVGSIVFVAKDAVNVK